MLKEMLKKTHEEKLCDLCDKHSTWFRHTKRIAELLDADPDLNINYLDDLGMTALHYAIFNEYVEAIDCLLKHHADPSLLDRKGVSPLGYAFELSHKDEEISKAIVDKLIKAGAQANIFTLRAIIDHYGFDKKVIVDLLSHERNQYGCNHGSMVDTSILKKAFNTKNISKKVVKLLSSFKECSETFLNHDQVEDGCINLKREKQIADPQTYEVDEHVTLDVDLSQFEATKNINKFSKDVLESKEQKAVLKNLMKAS